MAIAVVAIALPDCINPSLIGAELFFAGGQHPARQTVAFTVVTFAVTFLVGLALALGLGDLILSVVPKPGKTVKYALITGAGVVLLMASACQMLVAMLGMTIRASASRQAQRCWSEAGSPGWNC